MYTLRAKDLITEGIVQKLWFNIMAYIKLWVWVCWYSERQSSFDECTTTYINELCPCWLRSSILEYSPNFHHYDFNIAVPNGRVWISLLNIMAHIYHGCIILSSSLQRRSLFKKLHICGLIWIMVYYSSTKLSFITLPFILTF